MEDDLRDRMITLMKYLTADYGRYTWLEKRTGIPAQKWANLYNRRQRPTVEMIQGIAKLQPRYTEWLITGIAQTRFPEDPLDGLNRRLNRTLEDHLTLAEALYRQAAADEQEAYFSPLADGSPAGDFWTGIARQMGAPTLPSVAERLEEKANVAASLHKSLTQLQGELRRGDQED